LSLCPMISSGQYAREDGAVWAVKGDCLLCHVGLHIERALRACACVSGSKMRPLLKQQPVPQHGVHDIGICLNALQMLRCTSMDTKWKGLCRLCKCRHSVLLVYVLDRPA
jgi:hypothetical protein